MDNAIRKYIDMQRKAYRIIQKIGRLVFECKQTPSDSLIQELRILGRLPAHQNVIRLIGYNPGTHVTSCGLLVLELSKHGSLSDTLQEVTLIGSLRYKNMKFPRHYRHRFVHRFIIYN